jgi:hypothetical protein
MGRAHSLLAAHGFNVHSLVRTKTKPEAERVGKYMIRPVLSPERLSFLEQEGKVGYRHGEEGAEQETMDYLEFIARVTSPIPDKGQVTVRYYGLSANAHIHRSPEADVYGGVVVATYSGSKSTRHCETYGMMVVRYRRRTSQYKQSKERQAI